MIKYLDFEKPIEDIDKRISLIDQKDENWMEKTQLALVKKWKVFEKENSMKKLQKVTNESKRRFWKNWILRSWEAVACSENRDHFGFVSDQTNKSSRS